MIRISNVKIREDISDEELFDKILTKYKINKSDVSEKRIIKKSIDARNKADIFYNYAVEIKCKNENKIKNVQIVKEDQQAQIIGTFHVTLHATAKAACAETLELKGHAHEHRGG